MAAKSILLLPVTNNTNHEAVCAIRFGPVSGQASQYCSTVDSLAAEVFSRVSAHEDRPLVVIYGCVANAECLEAVLFVIQHAVESQQHQAWTGTAETWHLQQAATLNDSFSFTTRADTEASSQRTHTSQIQTMDDLHQFILTAVQSWQQSAADGCTITLAADAAGSPAAVAGQPAELHFVLVPDQPVGSHDADNSSSSSSRSVLTVSKMLVMAGVEAQKLPTWTLVRTEQQLLLPHNLQQLIARKNSSSSNSSITSPMFLLLLLPAAVDQAEDRPAAAAARMLQLAQACVPAAAAAAAAAAPAAAAIAAGNRSPKGSFVNTAPDNRMSAIQVPARNPQIDKLNQQVGHLQAQLDDAHAHYQQLLDQLVPRWRNDRAALETLDNKFGPPAAAAGADPSSSSSNTTSSAVSRHASMHRSETSSAAPTTAAAARSSMAAAAAGLAGSRTSAIFQSATTEVQRAVLEGQLEAVRKELRVAKERVSDLEAELANTTESSAAREGSLTSELKRVIVNANEAAKKAADERATLAAQVRQLQSELAESKSCHTSELKEAHQQMVTLADQVNRQLASTRADHANTPRTMAIAAQREAQEQVHSQQQLLTQQLNTLKTQTSKLQDQQQLKIDTLSMQLAAAEARQQQTEQQLQQLQRDAETVWSYALTLNEILCKCEAGHYPIQDKGGLRFYHITRQDKPAALSTEQIPELAQRLGIAKQYLALLKVPEPSAVFAGKLQYHTAAAAAGSTSSSSTPGTAGFKPYTYACVDPVAAAAAAGCHGVKNTGRAGPWMVSGTSCITQQHYQNDLALAGALNDAKANNTSSSNSSSRCSTPNAQQGRLSSSSRPQSAAAGGRRPYTAAAAGSSLTAAVDTSKLKQQLEHEMQAEMQQRAAAVLAQVGTAAAGGSSSSTGDGINASSADGGAAAAGDNDVVALAQYASNLQQQLDRSKQELQAERRQAAEMMIAVRSIQRTQADAAGSYLAGVTGPASPSRPSSALGTARSPQQQQQQQGFSSPVRPGSALGSSRQVQQQQQSVMATAARPASPLSRPGSAQGIRRPQSAVR